jgi:hypothetical protein
MCAARPGLGRPTGAVCYSAKATRADHYWIEGQDTGVVANVVIGQDNDAHLPVLGRTARATA